jgi:hypothetical protein
MVIVGVADPVNNGDRDPKRDREIVALQEGFHCSLLHILRCRFARLHLSSKSEQVILSTFGYLT